MGKACCGSCAKGHGCEGKKRRNPRKKVRGLQKARGAFTKRVHGRALHRRTWSRLKREGRTPRWYRLLPRSVRSKLFVTTLHSTRTRKKNPLTRREVASIRSDAARDVQYARELLRHKSDRTQKRAIASSLVSFAGGATRVAEKYGPVRYRWAMMRRGWKRSLRRLGERISLGGGRR